MYYTPSTLEYEKHHLTQQLFVGQPFANSTAYGSVNFRSETVFGWTFIHQICFQQQYNQRKWNIYQVPAKAV